MALKQPIRSLPCAAVTGAALARGAILRAGMGPLPVVSEPMNVSAVRFVGWGMQPIVSRGMTEQIERATAADARDAAFDGLVAAELDGAYRLAGVILGDRWQAEDATHDAVVQAWLRFGSLPRARTGSRPGSGGSSSTSAATAFSENAPAVRSPSTRIADRPDPTTARSAVDDRLLLDDAFAALSPDHRVALVLRYYADLPVEPIAELVGVPAGTVSRGSTPRRADAGRAGRGRGRFPMTDAAFDRRLREWLEGRDPGPVPSTLSESAARVHAETPIPAASRVWRAVIGSGRAGRAGLARPAASSCWSFSACSSPLSRRCWAPDRVRLRSRPGRTTSSASRPRTGTSARWPARSLVATRRSASTTCSSSSSSSTSRARRRPSERRRTLACSSTRPHHTPAGTAFLVIAPTTSPMPRTIARPHPRRRHAHRRAAGRLAGRGSAPGRAGAHRHGPPRRRRQRLRRRATHRQTS